MQNNIPKKRGRTRKTASQLGLENTMSTAGRRLAKDAISKTKLHPIAKIAILGAVGALITYFVKKK